MAYNDNKMNYVEPSNYEPATEPKPEENDEGWIGVILEYVSILVALPLFLLLSKVLPDPDWVINLDRILLFILTFIVIYFVAHSFKFITTIGLFAGIGFLTYGSLASGDHYGWKNAVFDYASLINSLNRDDDQGVYVLDFLVNENEKKIREACDYTNVRSFALKIIDENKEFKDKADDYYQYRTFIQSCAICKYVNENWNYVNDPKNEEYFAKASETLQSTKGKSFYGDCDDHSILLASLIKAIGGESRIVLADGHAYPEIRVQKKELNDIEFLIKSLYKIRNLKLHYHIDDNAIWLNMDYTGNYPGTRFLKGSEKIISVVNI